MESATAPAAGLSRAQGNARVARKLLLANNLLHVRDALRRNGWRAALVILLSQNRSNQFDIPRLVAQGAPGWSHVRIVATTLMRGRGAELALLAELMLLVVGAVLATYRSEALILAVDMTLTAQERLIAAAWAAAWEVPGATPLPRTHRL